MSELIERLRQLAKAVTEGPEGWHREFTMRVPAEPERDADLVISTAADELQRLTKQRDELVEATKGLLAVLSSSYARQEPVPLNCPEAAAGWSAIAKAEKNAG